MRIIQILLFLLIAYAGAQGKKTVSLGIFGEEGSKFKALKPLKQKFESAFAREGGFKITDNSAAIHKLMLNEYEYEEGIMVADDDGRQIGTLLKAQYLCIIISSSIGEGAFWLNAALINVAGEEGTVMANVQSNLSNQQDVNMAVDDLVSQLLQRAGGVFFDRSYPMDPLSKEFAKVLKKKITIKDGPCSANSMVVKISTEETECSGRKSLTTCSIDVSLEGSGCTNEAELHLRGTVRATDKDEKTATDVAKRNLLNGKADFLEDWIDELKQWSGRE